MDATAPGVAEHGQDVGVPPRRELGLGAGVEPVGPGVVAEQARDEGAGGQGRAQPLVPGLARQPHRLVRRLRRRAPGAALDLVEREHGLHRGDRGETSLRPQPGGGPVQQLGGGAVVGDDVGGHAEPEVVVGGRRAAGYQAADAASHLGALLHRRHLDQHGQDARVQRIGGQATDGVDEGPPGRPTRVAPPAALRGHPEHRDRQVVRPERPGLVGQRDEARELRTVDPQPRAQALDVDLVRAVEVEPAGLVEQSRDHVPASDRRRDVGGLEQAGDPSGRVRGQAGAAHQGRHRRGHRAEPPGPRRGGRELVGHLVVDAHRDRCAVRQPPVGRRDRPGERQVHGPPPLGCRPVAQGRGEERMGEVDRPRRAQREQARVHGRPEDGLVDVATDEQPGRGQNLGHVRPAVGRGHEQGVEGRRPEIPEAVRERPLDASPQRHGRRHTVGPVVDRRERHEGQRVPGGLVEHRLPVRRVEIGAPPVQDPAGVGLGEGTQVEHRQPGQARRPARGPCRDEDHDGIALESPGDEAEDLHGRRVQDVGVVDGEEQGMVQSGQREEVQRGQRDREHVRDLRGPGQRGEAEPVHLAQECPRPGRQRLDVVDQGSQEPAQPGIGHDDLGVGPGAGQRAPAARTPRGGGPLEQRRLADPRVAGQHEGAAAVVRGFEDRGELAGLGRAADGRGEDIRSWRHDPSSATERTVRTPP